MTETELDLEMLRTPFVKHVLNPVQALFDYMEEVVDEIKDPLTNAFHPSELIAATYQGTKVALTCLEIMGVELESDTLDVLDTILSKHEEYAQELETVWDVLNDINNESIVMGAIRNFRSSQSKFLGKLDSQFDVSPEGLIGKAIGSLVSQYKRTKWELEVIETYHDGLIGFINSLNYDLHDQFLPYLERDMMSAMDEL